MMDQLEQLLQQRLDLASSELAEAQAQLNNLQSKVDSLARRVEAFSRALDEERGEDSGTVMEQITSPEQAPVSTDNKSQMVRDLVAENSQFGTTIKDIRAAFTKANVSFHPNYPYALVRRLKKNGSVRELRGKLYPGKTGAASE
jgi:hypothetical protein